MSDIRRRLGWTMVILSLLLHLFTVLCFSRQPDRLAAFTVMPIWLWGCLGLLLSAVAFYFLRASLSLIVTAVWALTILVGSDEARALGHIGKQEPLPGRAEPFRNQPVIRVLTMNTGWLAFGDPAADIAAWQPDIVLLQQTPPADVQRIAETLYGGKGDYRTQWTNGIVTRWKIQTEQRHNLLRGQQLSILRPDGSLIEVVNVHLATAATDLALWNRSTWVSHYHNRQLRRREISVALQILDQTTPFPATPTIFGGDFNAPATDVVHRHLAADFVDAFAEVGTGWGDTFHRRLPILRIDHIYATRNFTPVRCRAVTTRHSDHRFVVADFLMR